MIFQLTHLANILFNPSHNTAHSAELTILRRIKPNNMHELHWISSYFAVITSDNSEIISEFNTSMIEINSD